MANGEKRRILFILAVALAALAVGLWHGLPQVYVPDTHIIRNALGMAKTRDLWPPAGTYSTYPYLLAYLLLPVYGLTYLAGRATGAYGSAGEFGRRVVDDPTLVYMEGRLLVVFFGLAAVFYLYRTARRLNLSAKEAAGAALLLALNPLFVQFGHQARPWVPLVAGIAFTMYHAAGIALHGRKRDTLLAVAGAGLTAAMHQVGAVALILPLAATLGCRGKEAFSFKGLWRLSCMIMLFDCTAFFLGYGHRVFGGPPLEVIETGRAALDLGGQKIVFGMFSGGLAWKMMKALFGYDPVGVLAGTVGLCYGIFFSRTLSGLRFALACFCGFLLLFFLIFNRL